MGGGYTIISGHMAKREVSGSANSLKMFYNNDFHVNSAISILQNISLDSLPTPPPSLLLTFGFPAHSHGQNNYDVKDPTEKCLFPPRNVYLSTTFENVWLFTYNILLIFLRQIRKEVPVALYEVGVYHLTLCCVPT